MAAGAKALMQRSFTVAQKAATAEESEDARKLAE